MAISNYLKTLNHVELVHAPADEAAAGAVNGTVIDQEALPARYDEAQVIVAGGAISGSPTAASVTVKVEHSDDNVSYADVTDLAIVEAATVALSAADGGGVAAFDSVIGRLAFRPQGCKRYLRFTRTIAFTAGTTPKAYSAVAVEFGCPHRV